MLSLKAMCKISETPTRIVIEQVVIFTLYDFVLQLSRNMKLDTIIERPE
jgi:hypothetical protein